MPPFVIERVDGLEDVFVIREEEYDWEKRGYNGAWRKIYHGEFTEEEKMATRVHIVVAKSKDGHERILRVCSDYGDATTKSRNTPAEQGTTWVNSYEVEDPVVTVPYRVWVRFEEGGVLLEPHIRSSIPMQKDVFEPMEPHSKNHGSITVDASSDEDAVAKAKAILAAYLTGGPVAQATKPVVPRR